MTRRKAGGTAGLIHNTAGAGVLVLVLVAIETGDGVGVMDGSGAGEQAARMDMKIIEMIIFFMGFDSETSISDSQRP
jgi:hypothetical protein